MFSAMDDFTRLLSWSLFVLHFGAGPSNNMDHSLTAVHMTKTFIQFQCESVRKTEPVVEATSQTTWGPICAWTKSHLSFDQKDWRFPANFAIS